MIQEPESLGFTSRSQKLKSTDLLDQLNNMAVFEYLQMVSEGAATQNGKTGHNPNLQKSPSLSASISILEEARSIIHNSNCSNTRSELSILNNLAIFEFLNKNYTSACDLIIKMYTKVKDKAQKKPTYIINLATILSKSGKLEKADAIIQKVKGSFSSLVQEQDAIQDLSFQMSVYMISALNNLKMNSYQQALQDLEEYDLKFLQKSRDEDVVAYAKFRRLKAIVCVKMGNLRDARKYLDF